MNTPQQRWTFDDEFLTAQHASGDAVRFTRAERAVLSALASRPGVIFSRQQLLDALSGDGSDASDRNVDFIVNRLRRKLGESARAPAYIATQYGEGYWWVPQNHGPRPGTADAFIVVGPIRGLPEDRERAAHGRLFAEELRRHLDRQTTPDLPVVLDADCPNAAAFSGSRPTYAIELDFLAHSGRLDCAVTTRDFGTGRVIGVSREPVGAGGQAAEGLAARIVEAIWLSVARRGSAPPAPEVEPLAVRMHNAGAVLAEATARWMEMERRVRAMIAADPADHEARLMLASGMHSRFIMEGPAQFLDQPGDPLASCDEMEELVLGVVPHLEGDDVHMMTIAKLLYFLDRGYERTAVGIAERAVATSPALASAFVAAGQLRLFEGDIEGGLALIDRGAELPGNSLEFATYLAAIRLQGALASGEAERVGAAVSKLLAVRPDSLPHFVLAYSCYVNAELPQEVAQRIDALPPAYLTAMVRWMHFTVGRLFKLEEHRSNYAFGTLGTLCPRAGTAIVPEEIRRSVPSLFGPGGRLAQYDAVATTGSPGAGRT